MCCSNWRLWGWAAAMLALAASAAWGQGGAPPAATGQEAEPAETAAAVAPDYRSMSAAELEAERLRIWNSPEMEEARAYIADYAQRSRQFTPIHAQQYLAALRQLSPEQMEHWLARYSAQRANMRRGAEVAARAREMAVRQALDRQQAVQQSFENASQASTAAAGVLRDQLSQQRRAGEQAALVRQTMRDMQVAQRYLPMYDWIVFPPLYVRQMAAATLPGDLPPGDPRNFIRGDVVGPAEAGGSVTPTIPIVPSP